VEKFISGLSEEKRNLIQSENDKLSQLPISALENLIVELKRLREMAWCFTAHIQDWATTPECRERRMTFLLTGEIPKEPVPDTQAPEQKAVPALTDKECLQKLEETGFIMINPYIKDRTVYLIRKTHTILDTFDELVKMIGSELRARSIMIQNLTKVAATLNNHRPKHTLKT
jgi:hypothetical protein